jgi:hypothetical protein
LFIFDDIVQAVGASRAAKHQEQFAREAMDLQRETYGGLRNDARQMWAQQRADQAPWMQAGQTSLAQLLKMMSGGYDHSQMASDPGFQFRMQEGQKALERSAAARGGLNSGGFMKGLARYSQGVASDEFGNRFNRLAGIAGMGQGSAQNLGALGGQHVGQMNQLGGNYANSMSSLFGAVGNARSAGEMGVSNALGGAIRSVGNLGMMAAGVPPAGMGGAGGGTIPTQGGNQQGWAPWDPSKSFTYGGG